MNFAGYGPKELVSGHNSGKSPDTILGYENAPMLTYPYGDGSYNLGILLDTI